VNRYFDAFAYPLRRQNLGVMLVGVFFLALGPTLISWIIPRQHMTGSALAFGLHFLILAYYAVFLQSILHASMEGRDDFPLWPELSHPTDLVEEFLSIVAPFVVSFLPLIVLRASVAGFSALQSMGFIFKSAVPSALAGASPGVQILSVVFLIVGWLYLPMAILVWSFYGGWSIFNPIAVVRTAWRTGPSYLLIVVLVAAMVIGAWAVSLIPGEYITPFAASLLTFYALVVAMRLLGTHYRLHREKLGWDDRRAPEPV